MKVLFCSTHHNSEVSYAHEKLNEEFQKLGKMQDILEQCDNEDDQQSPLVIFDCKESLDHDNEEDTINASAQQPFGTYVNLKLSKVALSKKGKKKCILQ